MAEETTTINEEDLYKYLAQSQSAPSPEEKHNVHTFLFRVATADDSTKVANLSAEELGSPTHPVRALKDYRLIAREIMNNEFIAKFFEQEAEDVLATSLSKEGFLDRLAITQTRQIADITKQKKENKSWFKSKKDDDKEEVKL